MGDFNQVNICWKPNSNKNERSNKFLIYLPGNFILQKLEKETRGSAILDLILTNWEELVDEMKVLGHLGSSDCVILEFKILRKGKAV